jgi:Protein of unknown function (DUF4242)
VPRDALAYRRPVTHADLRTFLVEAYVPRLDRRAATEISSRYQDAAHELAGKGIAICWLQSYAAIEDETYLCIVAARDADDVALLSRRAALVPDHVVQVVDLEAAVARD